MTTTTASVTTVLASTRRVHDAMRQVLADLNYGLRLTRIYLTDEAIYIIAPHDYALKKWEARYPEDERGDRAVIADGHPVPLHLAVEGDVEGGRS